MTSPLKPGRYLVEWTAEAGDIDFVDVTQEDIDAESDDMLAVQRALIEGGLPSGVDTLTVEIANFFPADRAHRP